jgi:hypothetical protein
LVGSETVFSVSNSTLAIEVESDSSLAIENGIGILCASGADLTFSGIADAVLTVSAGEVGIGSAASECGALNFRNGTYEIAANGSAIGAAGETSELGELTVGAGIFRLVGNVGFGSANGASTDMVVFGDGEAGGIEFEFNARVAGAAVVNGIAVNISVGPNITGVTNASYFISEEAEEVTLAAQATVFVQFRSVVGKQRSLNAPVLQIGEVYLAGVVLPVTLNFTGGGRNAVYVFGATGFLLATGPGSILIGVNRAGRLVHDGNATFFVPSEGIGFFENATVVLDRTSPPPTDPGGPSLSVAEIVGIAVGGAAFLAIVAVIVVCCIRKRTEQDCAGVDELGRKVPLNRAGDRSTAQDPLVGDSAI